MQNVMDLSGFYMYTEGSDLYEGDIARLRSPYETIATNSCLSFWFNMYGRDIDYLRVHLVRPGLGSLVCKVNSCNL